MLEQGLIKTNFVGRGWIIWWIGQVVEEDKWVGNSPGFTRTTKLPKRKDLTLDIKSGS